MERGKRARWTRTFVGLLGGLTTLLVLGCAGSDLDQHKDNPTGPIRAERSIPNVQGATSPLPLFGSPSAKAGPPPVQNTDVAGRWSLTCQPPSAGCPTFNVTLAPDGSVTDLDGHGPSQGSGRIRDGRLVLSMAGLGEFEGVLDPWGSRATGTVRGSSRMDARSAIAVRESIIEFDTGWWAFQFECPHGIVCKFTSFAAKVNDSRKGDGNLPAEVEIPGFYKGSNGVAGGYYGLDESGYHALNYDEDVHIAVAIEFIQHIFVWSPLGYFHGWKNAHGGHPPGCGWIYLYDGQHEWEDPPYPPVRAIALPGIRADQIDSSLLSKCPSNF